MTRASYNLPKEHRREPAPLVNPHEFCTLDDPSRLCAACRELWDETVEDAGQTRLPLECGE